MAKKIPFEISEEILEVQEQKTNSFICNGCGTIIILESNDSTRICPYCGVKS
jgi:rubrerythrin